MAGLNTPTILRTTNAKLALLLGAQHVAKDASGNILPKDDPKKPCLIVWAGGDKWMFWDLIGDEVSSAKG